MFPRKGTLQTGSDADLVLCMSINPGYSGQKFMPDALARIRELRELLPAKMHIQVDGEDVVRAYRRLVTALA